MRKSVIIILILVVAAIFLLRTCRDTEEQELRPITTSSFADDPLAGPLFRPNQLLVFYKDAPTPARIRAIKRSLIDRRVTDSVTIRRCNSCDSYVELWSAEGIHNAVSGEGVVGGSGGGGSHGVGEDSIASYSLNFIIKPPVELREMQSVKEILSQVRGERPPGNVSPRDTILVAVLDSGIDTVNIVHPGYLWTNRGETSGTSDADGNCYAGDRKGWNFVSNTPDITEDHPNLHGSLVTKYIIDAFGEQSRNFVRIMALKTHDQTGYGDLFNSVCAIHYAVANGANVINASWGFYFYDEGPHPYLTRLITDELSEKGILFITAAGNKLDEADNYAKDLYLTTHGITFPDTLLRNLAYHRFYPAELGDSANNVLTVTSNDNENVSPTQNYNSTYVGAGVHADTVMPGFMKFRLPFQSATGFVSGSSFATAIFTGAIAANVPKTLFQPGVDKKAVIDWLESNGNAIPLKIESSALLQDRQRIDRGRYLDRK